MTRAALLLAGAILLAAPSAPADEPIARRLAALKSLVDPTARARPLPRSVEVAKSCSAGAWWRATDYGVSARTNEAVRDASLRFGVDSALVRSVIRHESNGDPEAISHKGAMGLMQLMPATARMLGVVCPFDPRENVLGGTKYLRQLRNRLGSWPRALAGYHAGPRAVEQGRIPDITRRYVKRVLGSWRPHEVAATDL